METERWAASISNCNRSSHLAPIDDCKQELVVDVSIGCKAAAVLQTPLVQSGSDGMLVIILLSPSISSKHIRLDPIAVVVPVAAGVGGRRCSDADDGAIVVVVVLMVGPAILTLGSVDSLGIMVGAVRSSIAASPVSSVIKDCRRALTDVGNSAASSATPGQSEGSKSTPIFLLLLTMIRGW